MARPTKKKIQSNIELLAINIVDKERTNWEDAVVYVTEKVGFRMREMIRLFRKNFWGVYDQPIDPTTQREKFWIPLVETLVEPLVEPPVEINITYKNNKYINAQLPSIIEQLLNSLDFNSLENYGLISYFKSSTITSDNYQNLYNIFIHY